LDKAPDDPTAVAWRLEVEGFEADEPETWAALEVLLALAGDGGPATAGRLCWSSASGVPAVPCPRRPSAAIGDVEFGRGGIAADGGLVAPGLEMRSRASRSFCLTKLDSLPNFDVRHGCPSPHRLVFDP
jgi:hypothetical protein